MALNHVETGYTDDDLLSTGIKMKKSNAKKKKKQAARPQQQQPQKTLPQPEEPTLLQELKDLAEEVAEDIKNKKLREIEKEQGKDPETLLETFIDKVRGFGHAAKEFLSDLTSGDDNDHHDDHDYYKRESRPKRFGFEKPGFY